MKGLIACERSGTVRDEFTKLGFDVTSCDLQPSRTKGKHYQGNVLDIIDEGWDFMIAHPPCTFMSKAGARWMFPKAGVVSPQRFALAMEAKDFFMKLLNLNIPNIAIENPFPLKIVGLPECTQTIQPYQFGDPYSKKTLLWLKGFPQLKATSVLTDYKPYLPSNTGGKKRGQSFMYKSISQEESSKTFQGIAKAMAYQWGKYLLAEDKYTSMRHLSDLTDIELKMLSRSIGRMPNLFIDNRGLLHSFMPMLYHELIGMGVKPCRKDEIHKMRYFTELIDIPK